jgi:flagellar biosynthesis/type III secretory pathway chaperone
MILLEHFKKEMEVGEDLLSLLAEEEYALSHQNLQKLPDITLNKNNLVQKYLYLRNLRQQQLSPLGLPKDEALFPAWITQQKNPELHQLWENLTQVLRACQNINLLNGMMLQKLSLSNRNAIQALIGKDPTQSLYGPGSASSNMSNFNILG